MPLNATRGGELYNEKRFLGLCSGFFDISVGRWGSGFGANSNAVANPFAIADQNPNSGASNWLWLE